MWQIEKLVPGGEGLAHLDDGRVGFVGGVAPGERVEVQPEREKKGFLRASLVRVLTPSPERVEPPCRYAEQCGGCDWLHLEYAAQLRHKLTLLRDALARTGKLDPPPEVEIEAAPEPLSYRNRIRVHLERGKVGFRARASHELVDVASCSVASRQLDESLARLREVLAAQPEAFELFSEVELRVAPSGLPVLRFTLRKTSSVWRQRASGVLVALESQFGVAVAGEPSELTQRWPLVNDVELTVPPSAFLQVHWAMNQRLISDLVSEAQRRAVGRFVDLYAGAGNFTLPLLAAGMTGVAVEAVGAGASAAARSIADRALSGEVLTSDVGRGIDQLIESGRRFELVVLDPPRSGAAEVLTRLRALGVRSVAYCACDPVTLARDLHQLTQLGFRLDRVRAYDMFPGTHHFETLAWLSAPDQA